MAVWGIAKAKAQLSGLIYEVENDGPQKISRSGREVAVVLSMKDYRKLRDNKAPEVKSTKSFADAILNSPLHGMEIPRLKLRPREVGN